MIHQKLPHTAPAGLPSASAREEPWCWRAALAGRLFPKFLYRSLTVAALFRSRAHQRAVLIGLALIGLVTIGCLWIRPVIEAPGLTVLCLLAVVFSALLASLLTVAAREDARLARRREAHAAALYSLTKSLVVESEPDGILQAVIHRVLETFRLPIVMWLSDAGALTVRFLSPELVLDERQKAIAAWVFETGEEAGSGTGNFPDSMIRYRPLKTWHGVAGVLGMRENGVKEPLPNEQRELLGAFVNQAALAITRADLARTAQRAELLQETGKLQKALLNSVSHDLRTPLVSVIGGLNTVLQDAALLDESTQRTLLETARDEAVRLNRLIQNLLDMTRLEGGALLVKTEPCDVHDVVGAAFEQLGEAAHHHPISVAIAPDLPLVPMDHVLIVQVLVNLLDNAIKYSPGNAPIEIEAGIEDDRLQLRIADWGKEIPKQELERLFDAFFRGTSARGSCGMGLGLSICKGFVEAHHGRIWAKHREKGGTEIAFSLPIGPAR